MLRQADAEMQEVHSGPEIAVRSGEVNEEGRDVLMWLLP